MPVVQMQKVQILGTKDAKEALIAELQTQEIIQPANLQEKLLEEGFLQPSEVEKESWQEDIYHLEATLGYLDEFQEKRGILSGLLPTKILVEPEVFAQTAPKFPYGDIVKQTRELKKKAADIDNELSHLEGEINFFLPWESLPVPPADLKPTLNTNFLFLRGAKDNLEKLEESIGTVSAAHLELISSDDKEAYLLVIFLREKEEEISEVLEKNGFESVSLPPLEKEIKKIIQEKKASISGLRKEKEKLEASGKKLTQKQNELMMVYDHLTSQLKKEQAKEYLAESESVFALVGWIRKDDRKKLEKLLTEKFPATYLEEAEREKDEFPPIELTNNRLVKPFQEVSKLYGLPGFREVDPSPLLAPFFFIFFGLCLTDAGYGIILAALAFLGLKKMVLGEEGKRFLRLFIFCGIAAFFWGVLTGGWFGIEVKYLPAPLQRVMLFDPLEQLMTFFLLSLGFGIVQVLFGIGIEMYEQLREKNWIAAFNGPFPWLMIVPGGLVYFAADGDILPKTFLKPTMIAVCLGFGVMILTSFFKGKNPLLGLLTTVGLFIWKLKDLVGNVLSYSRLMALGLATGVIALVINTIAGIASQIPYVGILLAIIVLIGGHAFNLAINTLGSFVHTTRLQFVEFFSYFFEGGGEAFQPLQAERKYTLIKGLE